MRGGRVEELGVMVREQGGDRSRVVRGREVEGRGGIKWGECGESGRRLAREGKSASRVEGEVGVDECRL